MWVHKSWWARFLSPSRRTDLWCRDRSLPLRSQTRLLLMRWRSYSDTQSHLSLMTRHLQLLLVSASSVPRRSSSIANHKLSRKISMTWDSKSGQAARIGSQSPTADDLLGLRPLLSAIYYVHIGEAKWGAELSRLLWGLHAIDPWAWSCETTLVLPHFLGLPAKGNFALPLQVHTNQPSYLFWETTTWFCGPAIRPL